MIFRKEPIIFPQCEPATCDFRIFAKFCQRVISKFWVLKYAKIVMKSLFLRCFQKIPTATGTDSQLFEVSKLW